MVNAWSLAASILDGTFDEDYPIMTKKDIDEKTGLWSEPEPYQHSNYYYDYTRNDPDAENPFTEAFDYLMGESVTEKTPWIYESPDGGKTVYRYERGTDPLKRELVDIEMADVDDQRAHHFNDYTTEKTMAKTNHEFKYHEDEILKDIQEYVSRTYQGHYTGTKHEFRKVQTLSLIHI